MSLKKKMGAALATTALGAALIGGGTFAIFQDSATNTKNTFKAGTLDIAKEAETSFTGTIANLAPGDTGSQTFDIANRGSLDLRYDVAQALKSGAGSLVLGNSTKDLKLVIKRSIDNGVTWTTVTPGDNNFELAPNAVDKYEVDYELPFAADNDYQNGTSDYQLTFNAEQTAHN